MYGGWGGVNSHRSILFEVCSHYDDTRLLFPHHPPEVPHGPGEWSLCSNVSLWVVVMALKEEGGSGWR